ncbi:MAG: hypothetical protein OEN01_08075 [Candidatus Krumholzibacteria bacterium]|nr:hypothetical protein [Candidatus Krumholzibacteria bacterium]
MKKLSVVIVMLCVVTLVLAASGPPLTCPMEVNFYEDNPIWRGTVTGDISGYIFFTNIGTGKRGDQEPGMTLPFAEVWLISSDKKGKKMILTGTDEGVVSPNSDYRMNGLVTDAAPEWSHLIGRQAHASGYITWDPDTGMPLTAPGTFKIN